MRHFILFASLLVCGAAMAQQQVVLEEVTVTASRVQKSDEGLRIFPSQQQIESSASSWGLLQRLNLPQLTVNEAARTVAGPPDMGAVQIRINGVVVTEQDFYSQNKFNSRDK